MKLNPTKKQLREFGLLVGFGFPLLIGLFFPLLFQHDLKVWPLFLGIPLLFLGICSPKLLNIPYKLWMQLGHILGWFNSRLILGLVFLLVLQPISIFMRLLGYDPLKLKWHKDRSYREVKATFKVDLKRIF